MLKKMLFTLTFLGALGTTVAVAAKQSQGPLVSEMMAFVVKTNQQGKEVLKSSKLAEPGQVIEYQLVYKNTGQKALSGLAVTGPIPGNTSYLGKTASTQIPSNFLVSIDGGKTYEKTPVTRQVKNNAGKMETVVVAAEKYTHLRWRVSNSLKAGGKQLYTYRVKVK
ncbi:MAG: Unknown protein [uncultured Thiotrichaceae bacterium]|uniref:DUF11 domain-containing protein n=1 Tax=uncultured Thiotrichaceae bacterium TaxID=298394 RepID=A0A6S6U7Q6_9GAMM|nr:MAG: Unknown protein [uncultured Thiotrichaceae bacterium]